MFALLLLQPPAQAIIKYYTLIHLVNKNASLAMAVQNVPYQILQTLINLFAQFVIQDIQ